jgi:hypothetical protein
MCYIKHYSSSFASRRPNFAFTVLISLDSSDMSKCIVMKNTYLSDLLQKTALTIWDEELRQHRLCFEAVDQMLLNICDNS